MRKLIPLLFLSACAVPQPQHTPDLFQPVPQTQQYDAGSPFKLDGSAPPASGFCSHDSRCVLLLGANRALCVCPYTPKEGVFTRATSPKCFMRQPLTLYRCFNPQYPGEPCCVD